MPSAFEKVPFPAFLTRFSAWFPSSTDRGGEVPTDWRICGKPGESSIYAPPKGTHGIYSGSHLTIKTKRPVITAATSYT